MNRFKNIDFIIENCASKLNARLTKDRPGYPQVLRTFEERRIDWVEKKVNKAIIIQPNFENDGVNENLWNFINHAWYYDGKSTFPFRWSKNLVEEQDFSFIEIRIDKLLSDSIENLKNIQFENLK